MLLLPSLLLPLPPRPRRPSRKTLLLRKRVPSGASSASPATSLSMTSAATLFPSAGTVSRSLRESRVGERGRWKFDGSATKLARASKRDKGERSAVGVHLRAYLRFLCIPFPHVLLDEILLAYCVMRCVNDKVRSSKDDSFFSVASEDWSEKRRGATAATGFFLQQ